VITEEQKYISGIYRNFGFACSSPIGAMAFQFLVFDKNFSMLKILFCLLISALSWVIFYIGYNYIKEKKDVRR